MLEEAKNIVTDVTSGAIPLDDVPGFALFLAKKAIKPAIIIGAPVITVIVVVALLLAK